MSVGCVGVSWRRAWQPSSHSQSHTLSLIGSGSGVVCTSQQSLRPFIVIGIREEDGWGLCVSGARRHMDMDTEERVAMLDTYGMVECPCRICPLAHLTLLKKYSRAPTCTVQAVVRSAELSFCCEQRCTFRAACALGDERLPRHAVALT